MGTMLSAILGATTTRATGCSVCWEPRAQDWHGVEPHGRRIAGSVLGAPIDAVVIMLRTRFGSRGAIEAVALGALGLGASGFVLGFVGPILLAPGATQGSRPGLFIAGPLGFLCGAAGGWIFRDTQSGTRQPGVFLQANA